MGGYGKWNMTPNPYMGNMLADIGADIAAERAQPSKEVI